MGFRDLSEFLVVEPIVLPIKGKEYSFPGEVSARLWLQLQRLSDQMSRAQKALETGEEFNPDEEVISDETESEMMAEMLGGTDKEMIEDGCTSSQIKAVFYTIIAYHLSGREAAEAVWESQGEAPAPNRAQRRKRKTPAKSKASSASRAGSKTPVLTEVTDEAGPISLSAGT